MSICFLQITLDQEQMKTTETGGPKSNFLHSNSKSSPGRQIDPCAISFPRLSWNLCSWIPETFARHLFATLMLAWVCEGIVSGMLGN